MYSIFGNIKFGELIYEN